MGGTEILKPLEAATRIPLKPGYPRTIISLTDGDVLNDQIIRHVYDHNSMMRVCSIGIGNGISHYLIKNIGKAGKCTSEFIKDDEDIGQKSLYILQAAVSRYIQDIDMDTKCYNALKEVVFWDQATQSLVLKNMPCQQYVYIPNGNNINHCDITVTYYSSYYKKKYQETFTIPSFAQAEVTDIWHKLAYNAKIQDLAFQSKSIPMEEYNALKSQIIQLSTKYQILSEFTVFLTVVKEDAVDPSKLVKIDIPVVKSVDYSRSSIGSNNSSFQFKFSSVLLMIFMLLAIIL